MTEEEERQAVADWQAWRKARAEQSTSALAVRLRQGAPEGATRVCPQHRWVRQPDGIGMVCAECGLTSLGAIF